MDRDKVRAEVCHIVAAVAEVPPESVGVGTEFAELRMDSMQLLEVVAMAEKRFRVSLPDEVLPRLTSVEAAVDAVLRLMAHPAEFPLAES